MTATNADPIVLPAPENRSVVQIALNLLEDHANHCVVGAEPELRDERTEELMAAIRRLMRHG